jgi:carlactone C-19 oxidase
MELMASFYQWWEDLGSMLGVCAPFVATFFILFVGFFVNFYLPYWKLREVPGPAPTFLVGHLPLLARHGPDVFRVLAKNYGPIFRYVSLSNVYLCCKFYYHKFLLIQSVY